MGRCSRRSYQASSKMPPGPLPDRVRLLREIFTEDECSEVMDFQNPPSGVKEVRNAYGIHTSKQRCSPIGEEVISQVVKGVARIRLGCRNDRPFILEKTPTDSDINYSKLREYVDHAALKIDMKKTPGFPLNVQYSNNQIAFDACGEDIKLSAVARLHMILTLKLRPLCNHNRLGFVEMGFVDPSSVFIKKEPHPHRKFKDGKYRSINPVSLVDNLVETVLFKEAGDLLRPDMNYNGSSIGTGFTDKQTGETCSFVRNTTARFGPVVSDDVSGFDGVHTLEVLLATAEIDKLTYTSSEGLEAWNVANRNWCILTAYSCAAIGGELWIKLIPGMINSGSKDTSRRNTALRLIYSVLFGYVSNQDIQHATANGDDGLSWGIENIHSYKEAASDYCVELRDVIHCIDNFDFCSHNYNPKLGTAKLISWPKLVYSIISKPGMLKDDALQAALECRHNDEFRKIRQLVNKITFINETDVEEQGIPFSSPFPEQILAGELFDSDALANLIYFSD